MASKTNAGKSMLEYMKEHKNYTSGHATAILPKATEEEREKEKKTAKTVSNPVAKTYDIDKYAPAKTVLARYQQYANMPKTTESSGRKPNFWDLTVNSLKRGYVNSLYGQESYKAMTGQKNNKAYYEEKLKSEDYSFIPDAWYENALSGAMELLGQQVKQWTDKRSLVAGTAAAGAAAVAGQIGPQVLVPEEIITVPSAFFAGISAGSAASNFEIEAGLAYNEMIENGVSHETARNIALGVGAGNAAIEMVQIDDLIKSFKVLDVDDATKPFAKKLLSYLKDRGVNIASETAQEIAQEAVTTAGANAANKIDKGEWAYDWDEIGQRLGETATSSAMSFGLLGVGGDAIHYGVNKTANAIANKRSTPTVSTEVTTAHAKTDMDADIDNAAASIQNVDIENGGKAVENENSDKVSTNVTVPQTISVGDTFKDTKTGNTVTVTEHNAENTTVAVDTGTKTETRTLSNHQTDNLVASKQLERMESSETLSPKDAQTYNIVVSNLKRKAEERGLLDNNFFSALQNVNLYTPSASDRTLISTEFHRVFAGNTDPLIAGWLDAISADAQPVTSINKQNVPVSVEKKPITSIGTENASVNTNADSLKNESAKKAKNPFNPSEVKTLVKENRKPSIFEIEGAKFVTDGRIALKTDDSGIEFLNHAVNEYYSSVDGMHTVSADNISKVLTNKIIGTVNEFIPYSAEEIPSPANVCVVGNLAHIYNAKFVTALKKRSSTLKIMSGGNVGSTLLVGYDKNGSITGFAMPIMSKTAEYKHKDGSTIPFASDKNLKAFVKKTDHSVIETHESVKNISNNVLEKKTSAKKTNELFKKLTDSIPLLENDAVVYAATGNEFEAGEKKLSQQVYEYFESLGGIVHRENFGDVAINDKGVDSSIAHGMGRAKAIAFASVPAVIEKGRQIDFVENWKGRNYDSYVFAAPIQIGSQRAYVGVVVTKSDTDNRYYLHEVSDNEGNIIIIKKGDASFKSKSEAADNSSLLGETSPTTIIAQDNDAVNSIRTDAEKDTSNLTAKPEEALKKEPESDIIEENAEKDGAENDKPKSEILDRESNSDGGRLHAGASESAVETGTEKAGEAHRSRSREGLSESAGTGSNRPNVGNDGEGVHRRNDAENAVSEVRGASSGNERGRGELLGRGNGTVRGISEGSEQRGIISREEAQAVDTEVKKLEKKRPSNKGNFIITNDIATEFDNTPPSAKDNIEAIELLLTLENEGRAATAEEKAKE